VFGEIGKYFEGGFREIRLRAVLLHFVLPPAGPSATGVPYTPDVAPGARLWRIMRPDSRCYNL
jgi:hypothetical protein